MPFETAVQQLIQQNIDKPVALVAAARAYKLAGRHTTAYITFARYMAQHGVPKYLKNVQQQDRQQHGLH